MSLALAGHAPATFEIKSAHLSLVALLLISPDLTLLAAELDQRYGDMPGFFEGENTLIDLQPLQAVAPEAALDFGTLLPLLERHQLRPLAVRGGSEAQMAQALAAGLVAAPDAVMARSQPPAAAASTAQAPVAAPAAEPAPVPPGALVIDRPLRSGQQVYAKGCDLVVLAVVNDGAEVIADGSIHVYAPLRGRAIAQMDQRLQRAGQLEELRCQRRKTVIHQQKAGVAIIEGVGDLVGAPADIDGVDGHACPVAGHVVLQIPV